MFRTRAALGIGMAVALLTMTSTLALAQNLADTQVLRIGNGSEPATLDPQLTENSQDHHIERDLFEGLVYIDKNGKPVPGQAESWTLSPDGLTYTFKLRAGLKWSNGDPLTAEDFAWSWRRAVNPATGSKYSFLFFPIKNGEAIVTGADKKIDDLGVRAVDPQTFEVTLKAPTGYFLALLGHSTFLPVHRASVEKFGNQFTRAGNLVSNGPFVLKEWTPQSRVVAVKNPNYWDAANTHLAEVDYYPIENQNEELKRYRAGEIDVTNEVPSDQVDFIKKDLPGQLHIDPLLGTYYLGFNMTKPPFNDNPKLREAINMVIDREAIVSKITKTGEVPAYSWVPPGLPGYESQFVEWKDWPMAQRIAKAKELYKEAGYGPDKPLTVDLRYNTSENHKKIMIAVAAMIHQALGINASLVNEEFKVFLETRKEKKVTQLFRDGWLADYADPNSFAELLQSTSGLNDMGYNNPDYDKLVQTASMTVDPAKRDELLQQAEKLVVTDLPIVPIYGYTNKRLIKPYVVGFDLNILGYFYSKNVYIAKH
jgi:oligopeptide transport system substrate-binding protein